MQDFRNLQVWRKAHELAFETYRLSNRFPREESFGLTSQMRRSAASIPSNIAEGCGRGSNANLCRFLQIAMGSASELEYQSLLAHDLSYLTAEDHTQLDGKVIEVKRMLAKLLTKLRTEKLTN